MPPPGPALAARGRAPLRSHLLALCLLWLLPLAALAQSMPPGMGIEYIPIADSKPWREEAGTIEVAEVFAYGCVHCDDFHPMLTAWKRRAGDDLRLRYVPAVWSTDDAYGRAYFAIEALGRVAELHPRMFDAVHREGSLPARGATLQEIATFLVAQGLDPAKVRTALTSADTTAKMNAAKEFAVQARVRGTPTLIINGRYRVQGSSLEDSLRIADALIAVERAAAR